MGRQSSVWAAVVREAGNLSGPAVVERPSFRKGARVKQVLNSRSQQISSVMPVENWDGARIRFEVERRPGRRLLSPVKLEGCFCSLPLHPVESAAGPHVRQDFGSTAEGWEPSQVGRRSGELNKS